MNRPASAYPERGRTAWIVAQRPLRPAPPDPFRPHGVFLERERLASGRVVDSGVVLLTNRECPWRCLMCDLWRDTTAEPVPPGAIARQVERALAEWGSVRPEQVKLYNSGSFFDPAAIPEADHGPVAAAIGFARNVVVESHPLLVGERTLRWRDRLAGSLEVAMGLETAHPEVLRKLNKGFDLAQFARAAALLAKEGIALRVFLLVNPPFLAGDEGLAWVVKSAEFAFGCGAGAVTLIPTRTGNGALDRLLETGEFTPPTLAQFETTHRAVRALGRQRVFADTWALENFSRCPACLPARRARLEAINLTQVDEPTCGCAACGGA